MPRQILTKVVKVNPYFPELAKIKVAADFLRRGNIVAIPTETVYGLAVNLDNQKAVKRLYEIKNRTDNKPLTVHIAHLEKLEELATGIPDFTFKLTAKFWPGPLTLILYAKKNGVLRPAQGTSRDADQGLRRTIGFRFPRHPTALGIINESRSLIGVTSANISNERAAKSADEVLTQFDGLIDVVVDAGEANGIESTILDLTCFPPKIIREGTIADEVRQSLKDILRLKTKIILLVCTGNSCRSPMAKGYLWQLLKNREDIEIISAGVVARSGTSATAEAIKVMADLGVDISGHFTRHLSEDMIRKADLILVMEKSHKDAILTRVAEAKGKVYLLKEFGREAEVASDENLDIPDPIGQPLEFYQKCFTIIKEELERITKLL